MVCTVRIWPTLLFFLCFLQSPLLFSASDADALLKFKEPFNKDPPPEVFTTWMPNTVPCPDEGKGEPWKGIICYKGTVTGIRIVGLHGLPTDIDVSALEQMEALRIISLANNSIAGPLPEFNRLGNLKGLFLVDNGFSGEIPPEYFSKMLSLKKLWLVGNKFTGPIPTSLSQLANLKELKLEKNEFSGLIPPLPQKFTDLNLSYNHLEGKIPDGLSAFHENVFVGNIGLCGKPLPNECPQSPPAQSAVTSPAAENSRSSVWVAIAVLVVVVLLLLVATIVVVKRRREFDVLGREAYDDPVEMHIPPPITTAKQMEPTASSSRGAASSRKGSQSGKGSGAGDLCVVNDEKGIFGLPDLMKAAAEVLGNGSLGSAYKAVMTNGVAVVVKRMRDMNKIAKDGFDMEFRRLGGLHHRNILTPLAYHYRKEEKLVVYEYIPRGSLLFLLHGDRGSCQAELDWPTRLKIIHGIARGMAFLHTELSSYSLPHGNLKSSNIFLSADYEPLLSDYGFWSVVNPTQATQAMFAYKAPEATEYHFASPKCDVYCFGIVILEILTGKFPSQYLHNGTGGTDVVQWVLSALIEGKETELFDPEIASASDSYNEMEQLLYIGAACVEQNPEKRLTMRDAVRKIEEIQVGQARTTTLKEEYAKLSSSPMP